MKKIVLALAAILVFQTTAFSQKKAKLNKMDKEFLEKAADGLYAKLETTRGVIYCFLESKDAPMTVANFVGLAEGKIKNTAKGEGVPYYDGLKFHRIIPSFMIQGGCPQGTGMGDPGYKFPDELDPNTESGKTGYKRGVLAMANAGPNTNGSQFFIMHKDYALPYSYNIFGKVVKGIEAVDSIVITPRDGSDRPKTDQVINHITILRKGKDAEAFDAAKVFEFEKGNVAKKQEEINKLKIEKAKADFMAQEGIIKDKYGAATTTASGLKYIIEKAGEGAAPTATSQVTVHYTGMLLNGSKFDSSVDRGQPATFGLNQVIPGWTEGLQLLKPGGKAKLIIPPGLGYGANGYPPVIPPNSWLVFDVELIKVQ